MPIAPEYQTQYTEEDVKTFIQLANESIALLTTPKGRPGLSSGQSIEAFLLNPVSAIAPSYSAGKILEYRERLDYLAFKLNFVDPAWHLKCFFDIYLVPACMDSDEKAKQYYLESCETFGIDPDCDKYPSDYYKMSEAAYIEKLRDYCQRAERLLPKQACSDPGFFKHSLDFRSVAVTFTYDFTATQAACVKMLYEAWENGTPGLGSDTIFAELECHTRKMSDLFKNHPAWNTLIIHDKRSYKLNVPAKKKTQ